MIGIYKIENTITGDCYIGSSINIVQRKNRHFKDLKNKKHHSIILQRAYNKYGECSFYFKIIIIIKEALMLLPLEQYYLDKFKPKYNISPTAGSPLGCKHTKETCEKKRNYAILNSIKPPDYTWKEKQKSVIMLHYKTKEVLKAFQSISEACRFIGKDCTYASTISQCCKNKRYSAFGYRWVFNKEDIKNLRNKEEIIRWNKGKKTGNKCAKKIGQYDLDNNLIREWSSIKEAQQCTGASIKHCLSGRNKTSGGFIWKYL